MTVGHNRHFPFVHTQKFPEIMGFSFKFKVTGIFKIMNGDYLINSKIFMKCYAFIINKITPLYAIEYRIFGQNANNKYDSAKLLKDCTNIFEKRYTIMTVIQS